MKKLIDLIVGGTFLIAITIGIMIGHSGVKTYSAVKPIITEVAKATEATNIFTTTVEDYRFTKTIHSTEAILLVELSEVEVVAKKVTQPRLKQRLIPDEEEFLTVIELPKPNLMSLSSELLLVTMDYDNSDTLISNAMNNIAKLNKPDGLFKPDVSTSLTDLRDLMTTGDSSNESCSQHNGNHVLLSDG